MNKFSAIPLGAALSVLVCICSCATEQPLQQFIGYSDERSVLYEVRVARESLDADPLGVLARAWALQHNTQGYEQVSSLYADASARSLSEFQARIDGGDWSEAIRFYRSLDTLSLAPAGWTLDALIQARSRSWIDQGNGILANLDSLPSSTPEDDAPAPGIVSRMIQGTVTVWVDRGIRVEKGIGYADRVIGSGFFIDKRGYIVTNYHVIQSEVDPTYEGYSRLFIKLGDDPDTRIPAKVIGWDPSLDLALIKTEIDPPAVFQLGTSRDLKVGNRIYAIGSPAGLERTLTSGIVSAQNRRLLSVGDVLQIDAPINQGNSGGPIVDEVGRVQAVVFAGIEPYEGLNFAIPVEYLRLALPQLYAGGKATHPWLGSYGKTAILPGQSSPGGVSLLYSIPGSPCHIAGIPEGTVITAVNGTRVTTLEAFQSILIRERPGTIIRLSGLVDGGSSPESKPRDWYVILETRPEHPGKLAFERDTETRVLLPAFGFDLVSAGPAKKYMVKSVIRGSIADESGFMEQDVIDIKSIDVDEKAGVVQIQVQAKRRKSGYMDAFLGMGAYLDSPSYF